ncbi:hypothetical protein M9458_028611, partial [Cirrhinus mrigala]
VLPSSDGSEPVSESSSGLWVVREYALACTKIIPGTKHCNRHKCHRALRRFLERVPEEYSFGVLFCPCSDTLCGERRRKTIVPSCSYEERDGQPNCLNLESYCLKDNLC